MGLRERVLQWAAGVFLLVQTVGSGHWFLGSVMLFLWVGICFVGNRVHVARAEGGMAVGSVEAEP